MFWLSLSRIEHKVMKAIVLSTALVLLSVVAGGCGAAAKPTTTPTAATATPRIGVTPTPSGWQALVVMHTVTGAVVPQTEVLALEPATGHQLWSRVLMGYPGPFGPVRAGTTVAVSIGVPASPYPASQIAAFDLRTGATLWDRNFGPNTQAFIGTTGSSLIVVNSAVSTQAPGATQGLTIAALSPVDGSPRWQQTLAHQELFSAIRAADGAVYLLGGQSTAADTSYVLTAFSAASGTPLWHQTLGTGSLLGMVAGDGAVYVGRYPAHLVAAGLRTPTDALVNPALSPFSTSTLTAYRSTDGAQLWQVSGFAAPQAETGGILYATSATPVNTGQLSFSMLALKAATGTRVWLSSQLGLGDPTSKPFAAVDGQGVYAFAVPETTLRVHALQAASGAPRWDGLPNTMVQAGVAGLGRVFTATVPATPPGQAPQPANVTISALSASTGAVTWTLVVPHSQTATLALA